MMPHHEIRIQNAKLAAELLRELWSWLHKRWARK